MGHPRGAAAAVRTVHVLRPASAQGLASKMESPEATGDGKRDFEKATMIMVVMIMAWTMMVIMTMTMVRMTAAQWR